MQNIGVMLAGSILGARRGSLSLVLFVALVAVGMPVLTGWRGGFSVLLGPTGGFILSWTPDAFVIGWLVERSWNRLDFWKFLLFNVIGGVGVVYAIGIPWLAVVANMELGKAIVASIAAMIVKRSYPLIRG